MDETALRAYALMGARGRLVEIEREAAELRSWFPDLADGAPVTTTKRRSTTRKGGRPLSPAARKAISERMKVYWAARRKTK